MWVIESRYIGTLHESGRKGHFITVVQRKQPSRIVLGEKSGEKTDKNLVRKTRNRITGRRDFERPIRIGEHNSVRKTAVWSGSKSHRAGIVQTKSPNRRSLADGYRRNRLTLAFLNYQRAGKEGEQDENCA